MLIMENYGLKIFKFCDSVANFLRYFSFIFILSFLADIIMTMYLFLGNPGGMLTKANVPPSAGEAKQNIEFIYQAIDF